MDIKITDSMLREYLDTDATPVKIASCVSLCGPSIERITKEGKETVYHIEVTTNRVDAASAYGVAREAATILPEFGIRARLKNEKSAFGKSSKKLELSIQIDKKLCERFVAVALSDVEIKDSSALIQERLVAIGQRPLNNAIDITNYVMSMLGIPLHAFDYDTLGKKIIVREATKGEKFVTLDSKSHVAKGGEIVIDNGEEITDLPGVMGTKNTAVTQSTRNILLVSEHMDPLKIRKASLDHETRTMAATINEKDPDPNGIMDAIHFALSLFEKETNGKVSSEIFDWYPSPRVATSVKVEHERINKLLGISIEKDSITKILRSLGFFVEWKKDVAQIVTPTFRKKDIEIAEDIVEEVARIYGYFRLPSYLPTGSLPLESKETSFDFERKIKSLLKGWGGLEVYTLSMVSKDMATDHAFRIKNPLGSDGEYMRTSLMPSLLDAAADNTHEKNAFHLFEIANVYLKGKKNNPIEESRLAGIFANTDYRHAKGILEALFAELHISDTPTLTRVGNYFSYEYPVVWLMEHAQPTGSFHDISIHPPQVEDLTVVLNKETKVGDVINLIKHSSELIRQVDLQDIYEDAYTFRLTYQHAEKTLTNDEVKQERMHILEAFKKQLHIDTK